MTDAGVPLPRTTPGSAPDATANRRPVERLGGWVTASLLIGLASLGLPWGHSGAAGYVTSERVPVIAAGVAVILGWRLRSRSLVRVGMVLAVVALLLASLVGGGAIALAVSLVVLELGLRKAPWATWPHG